jgi:SAM-dependent methyltransferase
MGKFDKVGIKYGCDKASSHHCYLDAYEQILSGRKIEKFLELGVAHAKSLFMWGELFPDALIVGVDNNPDCRVHQRFNIDVVIADITDAAKMAAVAQLYGPFDVILDDCCHEIGTVKKGFDELWWRLNPNGGVYLIEDLDGSDPEVIKFMEQYNAKFVDCPDKVGYIKRPGLIIIEKL